MNVVGYGRMSTDKQQLSPKVQTDKISTWFKAQQSCGVLPPDAKFLGVVIDEAVSSRVDMLKRPEGHKLLCDLEQGDLVVVATLSRAFRSAADAEKTMLKLNEAGINIQFLDVPADTTQPTGRAILSFFAVWAKLERDLICERTANALEAKRKRGLPTRQASPGWRIVYTPNAARKDRSKASRYSPCTNERSVGIACRQLFRDGYTRLETFKAIRRSLRASGSTRKYSERTCVNFAAACSLGFPKISLAQASTLLGYRVDNVEFIRRNDHNSVTKELTKKLKDEGYTL